MLGTRVTGMNGESVFYLMNNDGSRRQVAQQDFEVFLRTWMSEHGVQVGSVAPSPPTPVAWSEVPVHDNPVHVTDASPTATGVGDWAPVVGLIGPLAVLQPSETGDAGLTDAWIKQRHVLMGQVKKAYEQALSWADREGLFRTTVTRSYGSDGVDESSQPGEYFEIVFDHAAFRASWLGQSNVALQQMATLYNQVNQQALVATRYDVVELALRGNVGALEGMAPAGYVMATRQALAIADLMLADDMSQEIMNAFGGPAVAPNALATAQEQARIYGVERVTQMSRYSAATWHVRAAYQQAYERALQQGSGAGWHEVPNLASDSASAEDRVDIPSTLIVFDPIRFTDWYLEQASLESRAFKEIYGKLKEGGRGLGSEAPVSLEFSDTGWLLNRDGTLAHSSGVVLDTNNHERLYRHESVFFDFSAGWMTPQENIYVDQDFVDKAFPVIYVLAVTALTAGTLGPAVGTLLTGATSGVAYTLVVAGTVGFAQGLASSAVAGDLSLKAALTSAVRRVLTAGLMQGLDTVLQGVDLPPEAIQALSLLGEITVGGVIERVMGGDFEEGVKSTIINIIARMIGGELAKSLGAISDPELLAVGQFAARVIVASVRALGKDPDDPLYAIAVDVLSSYADTLGTRKWPSYIESPPIPDNINGLTLGNEGTTLVQGSGGVAASPPPPPDAPTNNPYGIDGTGYVPEFVEQLAAPPSSDATQPSMVSAVSLFGRGAYDIDDGTGFDVSAAGQRDTGETVYAVTRNGSQVGEVEVFRGVMRVYRIEDDGSRTLVAEGPAGDGMLPVGGTIALPIPQNSAGTSGLKTVIALSRIASFLNLLSLSGSTPQPTEYKLADNLTLYVSNDGKSAWFVRHNPVLGGLASTYSRMSTPVEVRDGSILFDPDALRGEMGAPLPDSIVMSGLRPANVDRTLQTNSTGTALAMAGSPDPCKDFEGGQSHHMVPAQVMKNHEEFLLNIGFRLDTGENMIKLPSNDAEQQDIRDLCSETRPIHSGPHAEYSRAIDSRLAVIRSEYEAGNWSAAEARAAISNLQADIRGLLGSGSYPHINDRALADAIRALVIRKGP
jgi:hypothetical protein